MIALNRYRLRHLAKHNHPGAKRAAKLLERPERLIGLILLGNNFVNVLASVLATYITLRLVGEAGLIFAGAEFCDQTDPFEAGIGFTVPLKSKQEDFIGRSELEKRKANTELR